MPQPLSSTSTMACPVCSKSRTVTCSVFFVASCAFCMIWENTVESCSKSAKTWGACARTSSSGTGSCEEWLLTTFFKSCVKSISVGWLPLSPLRICSIKPVMRATEFSMVKMTSSTKAGLCLCFSALDTIRDCCARMFFKSWTM